MQQLMSCLPTGESDFLCPEKRCDRLGIRNLTGADCLHRFIQRQLQHVKKFSVIQILPFAVSRQTSRQKYFDAFIRIPHTGVHHPQMTPFIGYESGFLKKLPLSGGFNGFTRIDLPCRKLKQRPAQGIAELAFKEQFTAIQYRDDHDCTLMPYVFARCLASVRQANPVKAHVKKLPAKDLRTLHKCLAQMCNAIWLFGFHVMNT